MERQAGREQAAIDIQRMVRANAGRQQVGQQVGQHTFKEYLGEIKE